MLSQDNELIGFTAVCRGPRVDLRVVGGRYPVQSPLVSVAETAGRSAAFLGRLYYRQELRARVASHLPPEATVPGECTDATLALAAYCARGDDGLAGLEGDFALIVWDSANRRLVGVRDPMGGYPLFWTQQGQTVALATSLRSLMSLLPRATLDLEYLADYLTLPGCAREEVPSEHCVYEGVRRVLPGVMILLDSSSGRVTLRRYWNWLERIAEPTTDRHELIAQQYGDLLRRAVRERIHGRTASHLSGGMDSTAVSLLASSWMRAGVGEGPLHTLSLVYPKLPVMAREAARIEAALRQDRDLVPHLIAADEFAAFGLLPQHDEPWPAAFWIEPERALVEVAAHAGAATLLTGFGADEMVNLGPYHLTDLLRRGRVLRAWAEASRWARASACDRWSIFYPFGLSNLLPAWTRLGLRTLLHRGCAAVTSESQFALGAWIAPQFARRFALLDRAIGHARQMFSSCKPTLLSLALAGIASRYGDNGRWYLGAPRGLHRAHPFLDPRLSCFCLGVHARLEPQPGRCKPILADAMRGVLPEVIRNRRQHSTFNEFYYNALARSLPGLERLIRESPIDDLGLFDKRILCERLQQAVLGTGKGVSNLDRIVLTLSLVQWLSQSRARQKTTSASPIDNCVEPMVEDSAASPRPALAAALKGQESGASAHRI